MSTSDYTSKHITKFWSKVNKNGSVPIHAPELGNCWEWQAGGNGKGYGQFRVGSQRKGTHQVAWELTNGQIPDGLWVLHKCDNRTCCNPDHLFLGTVKDNITDMINKKRDNRGNYGNGEQSRRHKLTDQQVREIRRRCATKEITQRALAIEMNVDAATISLIVNRKTWK